MREHHSPSVVSRDRRSGEVAGVGIVGHEFVRLSAVSGKSDNDHIIDVAGCELVKTIPDCGDCRLLDPSAASSRRPVCR